MLAQMQGTTWLMAALVYGGGLRLLECLRLRVKDIDFQYRQLVIRDAKGQKDRITLLSQNLFEPLRNHLRCKDDDDLHTRAESRRQGSGQSVRNYRLSGPDSFPLPVAAGRCRHWDLTSATRGRGEGPQSRTLPVPVLPRVAQR